MKNMYFSRLGTMLHLYIQKEKKAMKTSILQKYIRGTTACMKRLMMATNGCVQMTLNYTYYSDSWFNGVKMAEEAMALRVDNCGPVKTQQKVFFLAAFIKVDERLA